MHRGILRAAIAAAILSTALVAAAPIPAAPPGDRLDVVRLVSNVPGAAAATDPNLVNGWGLARSAGSPWWVADNGAVTATGHGKATLYATPNAGPLAINPLVVTVDGGPTGTVFAGIANNFLVATTATTTLGPASFIFASEDGMIRAWRGGTAALVTAHGAPDAIYKGLAITPPTAASPMLYAADFHNGVVDMFNGAWTNVTPAGAFVDPKLKHHYAPFGIQTIGDRVFVTYAKQDADREDEIAGQGRGIVDAFDLQGNFLARVAKGGQLNAPWGLAIAPATFGRFAGDLLVGNFGDGKINAFEEKKDGKFEPRGTLKDNADGKDISIDGLWALEVGNSNNNGTPNDLFFTAGPADETQGLFGKIVAPS